jgi:hypothetical protein
MSEAQLFFAFPSAIFLLTEHYLLFKPVLRIRDKHPGSRIPILIYPASRIQQQQQRRGKSFCPLTFKSSHKFHKIENRLIFYQVAEKRVKTLVFTSNEHIQNFHIEQFLHLCS